MPDPRFFALHSPLTLADVARLTGARVKVGDEARRIAQASPLVLADDRSLSFLSDRRRLGELRQTRAAAVLVSAADAQEAPSGCAAIISESPHAAWGQIARALHAPILHEAGTAAIHPSARIEDGVILAPGVVIGQGASVGAGTVIQAGAVIGPGVAIGRRCQIGANASVAFALVGDGVSILAGARIGEAGFGVTGDANGAVDVPQLGRVILQDNVTIGANSCVDRGSWEDTVVGENTKLDNLVHIAHNVRMGRNCRLAAFTGISGSVTVGDGVLFGGRSGVADQLTVGAGAAIGAAAGVFKSVPAGEVWTGYPARPMRRWLREQAALARLSRGKKGASEDEKR